MSDVTTTILTVLVAMWSVVVVLVSLQRMQTARRNYEDSIARLNAERARLAMRSGAAAYAPLPQPDPQPDNLPLRALSALDRALDSYQPSSIRPGVHITIGEDAVLSIGPSFWTAAVPPPVSPAPAPLRWTRTRFDA